MNRRRSVLLAAIVLVVLAYMAGAVVVFGVAEDAVPVSADVILALAGNDDRAQLGLELLAEGIAETLVVSYAEDPEEPDNPRAQTARQVCGDPPEGVLCLVPHPATTRGEASTFAMLAAERGWRDVVLVTAGFHARRAGMIFRRCVDARVSVVQAPYLKNVVLDTGWVIHETGGLLDLLRDPPCPESGLPR